MERAKFIRQVLAVATAGAIGIMAIPAFAQERKPSVSATPTPYPADLIQNPVSRDFYERYRKEENERILRIPTLIPSPTTIPLDCDSTGSIQEGIATYYNRGNKFTAGGDEFDKNAMALAHLSLPMHTWVRVTNRESGSSRRAKVNDTGNFSHLADLTEGLALALGFNLDRGVFPIRIQRCV